MSDREVAARELGAALRELRARTGSTAGEFAKIVRWSDTKVSHIESDLLTITEIDVVLFAAFCRAAPDQLERLLSWSRKAELPGHWLPRHLSRLVYHENTALSSISYDPHVVPGLLQTENYLRAQCQQATSGPRDTEYFVLARLARQEVLLRRHFDFFVHERALRRPVGDNRVMTEQVRSLVEVAEHPWITIRVIPGTDRGKGALEDQFVQFCFHDGRRLLHRGHDMVQISEEVQVLAKYREHLVSIDAAALDQAQSRDLLVALAREFDADNRNSPVTQRYAVETHLHRVSSRSQR